MANNGIKSVGERELSSLVSILKQVDNNFFEPSSTAVTDLPIKEKEEPEYPDPGSISEDPRGFIQKGFDQLYSSGPIGAVAAAVADVLPGIPFVDIADPPQELEDSGMQQARNILGVLSMVGGMYKTPQAVGRVATNIKEPWGYSPPGLLSDVKRLGIKESIKRFVKDKPLYEDASPSWRASSDAREFLYRRMFGLKPRKGKNIFIENADGTLSFNPKSNRARSLLREIVSPKMLSDTGRHSVLGGYKRTQVQDLHKSELKPFLDKPLVVDYEDIWNFKMNPGEWASIFQLKDPSEKVGMGALGALRTLVDLITKPAHVKGRLKMDKWGKFAGEDDPIKDDIYKFFEKLKLTPDDIKEAEKSVRKFK